MKDLVELKYFGGIQIINLRPITFTMQCICEQSTFNLDLKKKKVYVPVYECNLMVFFFSFAFC